MKTLIITSILILSASAYASPNDSKKVSKVKTCAFAGVRYPIGSFVRNSPNTIQECTQKNGYPFWKEPIQLPTK